MTKKRYYSRPKIEIITMDVDELMRDQQYSTWRAGDGEKVLDIIEGTPGYNPNGDGYKDPYGGEDEAKGGNIWDIWE